MTAHRKADRPQPQSEHDNLDHAPPRPPSPASSSNSAEHDDDDRLSLSSDDLDASWMDVTAPRAMSNSMTESAFGSSTISEMAISDRTSEPSERGDETDGWALSSETGSELQTDAEVGAHSADEDEEHLETPSLPRSTRTGREDNPDAEAFQRSFIFPDPHSPSQSFSSSWTSTTGTVVDTTPQRSLANIRTEQPWGGMKISAGPFVQPKDTKPITTRSVAATIAGEHTATPKAESFRATPPTPGRRWSMMTAILAVVVLFVEFGPTPDLVSMVSRRFSTPNNTPEALPTPPPARTWLETPDVKIVRDAITSLSTDTMSRDLTVAEQTSTQSQAWTDIVRKKAEAVTDFIIVPQTKSLSVVNRSKTSAIMLMDDYARWTGDFIHGLYLTTLDYLTHETEVVKRQLRHYKDMAALFIRSEPVRTAVETTLVAAATSQETLRNVYIQAQEHVCANGRCDRAVLTARAAARIVAKNARHAATAAQRRGLDTVSRARRGLDNVIRAGHDIVNEAAAEAAARYKSKDTSTHKGHGKCGSKTKTKTKCTADKGAHSRGRRWSRESSKSKHSKKLKCGFRGKLHGCGRVRADIGRTDIQ